MADREDFATAVGALIKGRMAMPTTTLTTENLDAVTAPGFHMQQNNADATLARNYPYAEVSGNILVMPLNPAWNTFTQVFFPNNAFAVGFATRSLRNGVWSDWAPFDTRSTADRRYAPIAVEEQVAALSEAVPRLGTPGAVKVAPLALTTGQSVAPYNTERSVRVPLRFNAPVGRWRLHVRNWNPRLGLVTAAPVDFTGLWIADTPGNGAISGTPTQLRTAWSTPADGSGWVSAWFDAPIGDDTDRLLCFGYSTATQPPALTGGSWQNADPAQAISGAAHGRASLTPFDLWIEAETPASTPVIAGVGDSLTSGTGASLPVHESWVSQYARRVGGLPLHMSHHGDSMYGFLTVNSDKVTRWDHLAKADAVVWALGSNDIADGRTLAQMQADYATLRTTIEKAVGPVEYVATVQPRNNWGAAQEAARDAWNAWLTSRPEARGVFDFAAAVSADGDTIRPEYDSGDGAHLNTAGYAAEQATITTPIAAPAPVTVARVDTVEDRLATALHDSGIRSITGQNLASGNIRFQAKNGWCYLDLTNVNLSGAGGNTTILPDNGQLSGYAPSSPMQGKGQVVEVNTSRSYRIVVNYWGGVIIYGAPVGTVLNGYAIWPLNRPIPAMPPGAPA